MSAVFMELIQTQTKLALVTLTQEEAVVVSTVPVLSKMLSQDSKVFALRKKKLIGEEGQLSNKMLVPIKLTGDSPSSGANAVGHIFCPCEHKGYLVVVNIFSCVGQIDLKICAGLLEWA